MLASVCTGPDTLELREWPEPRIGSGELLVRVSGCGLCGSDIVKIVRGPAAPVVLGHEVVGVVEAVGPGVAGFAPGQRVVVAHHVPCAACHYCRRGSPSMCRTFKRINLDPGGFAERLRVPAPNVAHATFALPDALSDEVASFTEPLACCLRAVKRSDIAAGDTVVVVGLGSIGCLLAQGFALAGARVIGWDVDGARRALARRHQVAAPDTVAEVEARVADATEGRGADVVALSAGGAGVLPWAAARVRDGGRLHYFAGGDGEHLPLALETLYARELTLTATYSSSPAELAEAFALLARGAVSVAGLVTHRLPLARLAEGVALMRARQAVKVYVTP